MKDLQAVPESQGPLNNLGGGPPPGYGAHPNEAKFWETPIFRKHPLTGRLEAAEMGLFFRLWPENVTKLQEMKLDDWPHTEIVKVAKELWDRQNEEYDKDEDLAAQHRDQDHGQKKQEIAGMQDGLPSEAQGSAPMPPGTFARGFSFSDGKDYRSKLENFRGRFFSKDSGAYMSKTEGDMGGARVMLKSQPQQGTVILLKGEAGGERAPTIAEVTRRRAQTFTRKEAGVMNSKPTSDPALGEEDAL